MLRETVEMTREILAENRDAAALKAAWQRGTHLKQFGINYRWSSIVFDERYASPDAQHASAEALNAYGTEGDVVRAGDRAPNATGLVRLDLEGDTQTIDLFSIFGPTHHTAIVFGSESSAMEAILKSLKTYPPSTVSSAVVYPRSTPASESPAHGLDGADHVLQDSDGFAFTGYDMPETRSTVVVVRPDGVVGAVVHDIDGIAKYFAPIFAVSATTSQ